MAMDAKTKRSMSGKINTRVARELKKDSYIKTKNNWFVKSFDDFALFMHLHLFSFTSAYRVHLGVRMLQDTFDAIALNGPIFEGQKKDNLVNPETGRLYHLSFQKVSPTYEQCANEIVSLFKNECLPWLLDQESSLLSGQRQDQFIAKKLSPEFVSNSKKLLGLRSK